MTVNLSNSDRVLQRVFKHKFLVIFYILMTYNYLLVKKKTEVWDSLYENWSNLVRIFEGVRLLLELQFLFRFCILMIYKHLLTCDKNFQLEARDMKIDLFLGDFERAGLIQEPEVLVSFCIRRCNNKRNDDKKI